MLRKNLTVEKGELTLFDDIRYFFYITNDFDKLTTQEVAYFSNDRCDHENDIKQLKNGVNAMRMPSDNLISNWAYMVIASLAWNLKSWYGLAIPNESFKRQVIRMEFKRFINTFIKIPCIIVKTGRQIIYRIIGYNNRLSEFFNIFAVIKKLRFT